MRRRPLPRPTSPWLRRLLENGKELTIGRGCLRPCPKGPNMELSSSRESTLLGAWQAERLGDEQPRFLSSPRCWTLAVCERIVVDIRLESS